MNNVIVKRVLATRILVAADPPHQKVVVTLGKPRRMKGSTDWECPFQISGSGMHGVKYGRGLDAFQALTTAIQGVWFYLDQAKVKLGWSGVFKDQSGFCRVLPLLDPQGARRMNRVVDREFRARLTQLTRRRKARERTIRSKA